MIPIRDRLKILFEAAEVLGIDEAGLVREISYVICTEYADKLKQPAKPGPRRKQHNTATIEKHWGQYLPRKYPD